MQINERYLLEVNQEHCRPVFLVGMNGSGTTMLRDCLSRHPHLYGFPKETRLLPDALNSQEAAADLTDDEHFIRFWERINNIPAIKFANDDKCPPLPDNWKDFPRSIEHVVDAVFRYFARRENKQRWVEKTPHYVQHIEMLSTVFPEARFVHIIRDGRECSASFHRRWGRNPNLTIYRWRQAVDEGRRQGEAVGRKYLEVKFENVTHEPEKWMRIICDHIGVDFHPNVLISKRPNMEGLKGKLGGIVKNTNKWRAYFNKRQLSQIETIAGGTLKELGYAEVTTAGDQKPGALRLILWRMQDYARQFKSEIRSKLKGESHKSWANVYRLPYVAIKQWRMNKY